MDPTKLAAAALAIVEQEVVGRTTQKSRRKDMTDEEAFFAICKEGACNEVRIFLEDGANYNIIDRSGNTPLLHAVNGGHVDVARELLEAGADPDKPDRSGHSPLHKASQAGHVDMMKLLVFDYDADLEQNDKTGRTSLHLAANNGHVEAVKILISAGTIINSTTTDGYTALHWACWNGRLEVAVLLYEAGADVDCATKFGNTPLHKAIEKKRVQVIKWLVFKGANVSAVNKGSKQPLDMLKYTERLEILNEDNYPLHALIAHRSSLWLQIVVFSAKEGSIQRILSYCSRYPQLAYVRDEKGLEVTDMLEGKNKKLMIAMLHWHGRYRLLENVPLYSSSSTVVLHAIDTLSLDNLGKPCHVALKFLLNKDRYRREIDTRACKLSDEYVLNVLANYPKYSPETMQTRLNPTYQQNFSFARKHSSPHALSRKNSVAIPFPFPLSRRSSKANHHVGSFRGSNRRHSPDHSPQLSPRTTSKSSPSHMHTSSTTSTGGSIGAVSTNPPQPSSSALYMNSAQYVYVADQSLKESMTSEPTLYLNDSPELREAPQDVDMDFNEVTTRSNGGCELSKEEAEKLYCVVLPLALRTLYVAMKHEMRFAGGPTTVTEVKAVFSQLLRCISHLHDAFIIHGDIKPMNIVFHSGRWKLTDLDSAVVIGELPTGRYSSSSAYMPPECFFIDETTDEIKVGFGELSHRLPHVTAHQSFDIWSLGCILYQLCNEDFRLLFSGDQSDNLSTEKFHKDYVTGKLSKQQYQNSLWALHEWSDDLKASKLARVQDPLARSLLSDMLHKTPSKRPTIDEILIHPFLTGIAPNAAETTTTRRGTHFSQSIKLKVEAIHASAPPSATISRNASICVGEIPVVDGSPTTGGVVNIATNASTKKDKKGPTQSFAPAVVGFSQSERLHTPERGPGRGGPESDIVMESIPRPTSTGSRIDIHRALHDAKEGENVELRAQLAEAKEEKQILLAEMERLRARLGINSAPIVASTATLDLSPLPISGAE